MRQIAVPPRETAMTASLAALPGSFGSQRSHRSPGEASRTAPDLFSAPTLTLHESQGFALGFDYARYQQALPAPFDAQASALRDGWLAGRATMGRRSGEPSWHVAQWLQLRLHAWLHGRSVEGLQLNASYLRQIAASHCPVTRVALRTSAQHGGAAAVVERLRSDAGYAAGHVVSMSSAASLAKGALDYAEVQAIARRQAHNPLAYAAGFSAGATQGLTAEQWARMAVLCSFVQPLSHEEACAIPMLVLPPNRVRLLNPAQALQAWVSRQLLHAGWSQRFARFGALLPTASTRQSFQLLVHAMLPRVLAAGRDAQGVALRWAVEDAWLDARVQQRWQAFAGSLTPAQCESLVLRASARGLGTGRVVSQSPAVATEGWALETRGYVPHRLVSRPMAQAQRAA